MLARTVIAFITLALSASAMKSETHSKRLLNGLLGLSGGGGDNGCGAQSAMLLNASLLNTYNCPTVSDGNSPSGGGGAGGGGGGLLGGLLGVIGLKEDQHGKSDKVAKRSVETASI